MARATAVVVALGVLLCCQHLVDGARVAPSWADHLLRPFRQDSVSKKPRERSECDDPDFRRANLKLLKEMPFVGLLGDLRNQTKFEASGMVAALGHLWVVFDNLHAIGRFHETFRYKDEHSKLFGSLDEDSQFEGLAYVEKRRTFFAIQEAVDHEEHGLVPFTQEIEVDQKQHNYRVVRRCPVHFQLTHDNKGFEGMHIQTWKDGMFLLGLCEGNRCVGGEDGRDPGHGRLVVAAYYEEGDRCGWNVVKEVHIPRTAYFVDYSGLSFNPNNDRVAITSQENSTMWMGTFDWDELEFVDSDNDVVYHFPRNPHCHYQYCNVEGVEWLDNQRLVVVSDKAKSHQPYECTFKDQTLSIFSLPVV